MISSISLPALSTPAPSTSPIRDVRATERLAPANSSRVLAVPSATGVAPSPQSPRGSILNLSV